MKTRRTIGGAFAVAMVALALLSACAEKPEALVASAKGYLAKNDPAAAILQLKNALQQDPDLAEARFLLGKAELDTGEVLAAQKELRRALELKYPADQVIPPLAEAMLRSGDAKKVVGEFATVQLTTPGARAELQTALGSAHLVLRNFEASKAAFAAAITAKPDHPPAILGQAQLAAAQGDLPGAMTLVESALAKAPALAEGWQLKGDLLLAQGQSEPALAAYRKAVETDSGHLMARFRIITLLMRQNKVDESNKEFAALQKIAPKNPQTYYLQALLAYRGKDFVGARDAIQSHLKAAPNNLLGVLLGADIDSQLGSYAKAEAALTTVLQRAPRNVLARRMLVQTNLRSGRPEKAREALQPLLQDPKADAATLALAGEVYAQNGDVSAAAGYFERAKALEPKSPGIRTATALSHLAMGDTERGVSELEEAAAEDTGIRGDLVLVALNLRKGNFQAALAAIDAIERKQPNKPLPHRLRGGALLAKGDVPGARRSFERALEIDPTYLPAASNLALLDLKDKKPDDAKKRLEAVLAKDPKSSRALLLLADLRARSGGKHDEVVALIEKAVAANPTDVEARIALINIWKGKDSRRQVTVAQEAYAALPDRAEILDALGQAYRAASDANQAIATYSKLAALQPGTTLPFMRLAEIHMAAGDNAAAVDSLRKALAINPDLVDAQRYMLALSIRGGRIDDALALARDLQKRRPKESLGYLLEGHIYAARKAWTNAIAVYRTGLNRVGTPDLAIYLHAALVGSGKTPEANALVASWLKDHPDDRALRVYLAEKAIGAKDYAGAAKLYKTMLEIKPDDPFALNNLAWVSGQLKDPKALEYAERANKLAPDAATILDTYGMLLVEKGETARGLEMLQKAVGLAPNNAPIRLNLASALVKSGQKEAAKKELDTVAKLGGRHAAEAEAAKTALGL